MPLEVREIVDDDDFRRYEMLVRTSPAGSVFSSKTWLDYAGVTARFFGVYKGAECIAGVAVPHAGGRVVPVCHGTPWTGIVARPGDEGEHVQIASEVARYLRRKFGTCSLTMPPEWRDIRPFLWDGWRSHVRYTYRGDVPHYEKRLKFRDCFVNIKVTVDCEDWEIRSYRTGDSHVDGLFDWKYGYYWNANGGGQWHAECVNTLIRQAQDRRLGFDMVGCNSPQRSLFKRAFGGELTPYYFVTTGDPADVEEFWGEQRPRRLAA